MLRDITIGKYYNKASVIHQMDCRTKLAGTLLYIIALFFVENPIVYIPCLVYLLILYRLAAIPWSYILKGLRGFALLLLFTFVFQSLITDGRALFSIGIFTVSQEGLLKAVRLVSRIVLMVLMASLLAYTTTPKQMAAGLEKSLGFLEKIKVPVYEMAMMVSIAFRFIPVFIEEVNIIMDAQASRGVDFHSGNVVKRMGKVMPLVVPLFVSAIRRSADLAMAMEARGYTDAGSRTRYRELVYTSKDRTAYLVILVMTSAVIVAGLLV